MTRLEDRQTLVAAITVACAAGARLAPACALVGIDLRTFSAGEAATARSRRTVGPRLSGPGRHTP